MTGAIAIPRHHVPAGEDFLLLSPTEQAYAYRNVDRMFVTRAIRRGTTVLPLQRGEEISPHYQADGKTHGVDAYFGRANVAGLLVIKGEKIVLERYALGLEENVRWSSMSMIKSLTSTLIGAALQQGAIGSLDDAVSKYIPALRGCAYDAVSIRHLITMSSGVRWNEDYTDRNSDVNRYSKSLGDKVPGGVLALMRSLKAEHRPGSHFNYNSGDTYLLGSLLSAATGKTLADYMSETIWSPLGMEFDAFYTLESDGGQEIGGSRAGIALRDFGRFGVFLLRGGVIDGTAVLPSDWIESAAHPAFVLDPETNRYGARGYGYSWWIDPDGSMVALGFAGQALYVNRKAGVVIVTLSCQPQPPYAASYSVDLKAEQHLFKDAVLVACG
ncbi:serine hydrolase [Bradyrhizobium sp. AUGA SZCCT0431]|uniref:serine hydrolase domain-containing protein n=1 Tax=Bradyrhizobium sp. AUGA SZCCT0431 TaxID=2807674 RepID=UPI001BAE28E8|nr:serine hydrolase [Bradyrhizobium sp. AUGA SZCCT0431]MBR1141898.1 serine hydrolase [Bradyrhizobium sp. AUGA SZCCT0431]